MVKSLERDPRGETEKDQYLVFFFGLIFFFFFGPSSWGQANCHPKKNFFLGKERCLGGVGWGEGGGGWGETAE